MTFSDASLHLYKRVFPSVGPSVGPSVRNTFTLRPTRSDLSRVYGHVVLLFFFLSTFFAWVGFFPFDYATTRRWSLATIQVGARSSHVACAGQFENHNPWGKKKRKGGESQNRAALLTLCNIQRLLHVSIRHTDSFVINETWYTLIGLPLHKHNTHRGVM